MTSNPRFDVLVLIAWLFFIAMGVLLSLVVPLGEGFDEPWHFAYIQYVAQTRSLSLGPWLHLPQEAHDFLANHPIGWRLHQIYSTLHSQEEYWSSAEATRNDLDQKLREIRFSGKYVASNGVFTRQYESHQAPLFYVLAAPLFLLGTAFLPLVDTFLLMRIWSVLLASLAVPLSYLLARSVLGSRYDAMWIPLLMVLFPGLYPAATRVSNDALAIPTGAAIFLFLVRYLKDRRSRDAWVLAVLLLAGLFTKAFFIPIFFAIAAVLIAFGERRAAIVAGLVSLPGWLWYVRNYSMLESWTGLPETVSAKTSFLSSLVAIASINWVDVFELAALSHIWMGNWSLLKYRNWIYEVLLLIFALGVLGMIARLRRQPDHIMHALLGVYVVFLASLVYYATQIFQLTGVPVIQGWYLTSFIPVEAMIFVAGITHLLSPKASRWTLLAAAGSLFALLVYSTFFIEAPYYSGLISHGPSGHLETYHPEWSHVTLISVRLVRLHPWIPDFLPIVLAALVVGLGILLLCSG